MELFRNRRQPSPWQQPICVESVAAAWAIGEYFVEHALAAYALMGGDPNVALARRTLDWIRRTHSTEFTTRECHQSHRNVGPKQLDPALAILEGRGFIRRAELDCEPHFTDLLVHPT